MANGVVCSLGSNERNVHLVGVVVFFPLMDVMACSGGRSAPLVGGVIEGPPTFSSWKIALSSALCDVLGDIAYISLKGP